MDPTRHLENVYNEKGIEGLNPQDCIEGVSAMTLRANGINGCLRLEIKFG